MKLQEKIKSWCKDEKFMSFAQERARKEVCEVTENHRIDPQYEELDEAFEYDDRYIAPLVTYLTYKLRLALLQRNAGKRKRGIWWVLVHVEMQGAVERTARLQQEAERRDIPVKLYSGGEVFYSLDIVERLEQGKAGTLAGSSYVLTEFLPGEEWNYIYNGAYELAAAGYIPVIAHLERYMNVVSDFDRVEELKNIGCLIQVNASDLPGLVAPLVKRAARRLVREELADLVATDAHSASGSRTFNLEECAAWLKRKCSREYAERLLYANAAAILDKKQI